MFINSSIGLVVVRTIKNVIQKKMNNVAQHTREVAQKAFVYIVEEIYCKVMA